MDLQVSLLRFSNNFVDVMVGEFGNESVWCFTRFMALFLLPWLVYDDFNEIMYNFEKEGATQG